MEVDDVTNSEQSEPVTPGMDPTPAHSNGAGVPLLVVIDTDCSRRLSIARTVCRPNLAVLGLDYSELAEGIANLQPAVTVVNPNASQALAVAAALSKISGPTAVVVGLNGSQRLKSLLPENVRIVTVQNFDNHAELQSRVDDGIPRACGVNAPFSLAEYVQLAGLGGHTVGLACEKNDGAWVGELCVIEGRIQTAKTADATGFLAFADLVVQTELTVRFFTPPTTSPDPSLEDNWQSLILAAMTREDERCRSPSCESSSATPASERSFRGLVSEAPPSRKMLARAAAVPTVQVTRLRDALEFAADGPAKGVRELIEEGVRAVIDEDYTRAIDRLKRAAELDPKNRAVRHQLQRLDAIRHGGGEK